MERTHTSRRSSAPVGGLRIQPRFGPTSAGGLEPLRPPLKWAGGKRRLVPHLRRYWRDHSKRRLVEPFCGGLAVTLGLIPDRALLNDINPHVINFYQWVKRGLVVNIAMEKSKKSYYKYRTEFNSLLEGGEEQSERAALIFYYLNRTGYNGLCRFNRQGGFNVPYGRYKTINYPKDFLGHRSAFSRWEFVSHDFEELRLHPDDFVYADPPYDVEFTQYAKHGFSWDDQKRAAKWLAAHPGPVVLSNQATKRIVDLYDSLGFELEVMKAPRFISCNGDRTPANEVLAVKNI